MGGVVGARVCFSAAKRLGVTNPQLFYVLFRNPVFDSVLPWVFL